MIWSCHACPRPWSSRLSGCRRGRVSRVSPPFLVRGNPSAAGQAGSPHDRFALGVFHGGSGRVCILQGELPQDLPLSSGAAWTPAPACLGDIPGPEHARGGVDGDRTLARVRRLPAGARARLGLRLRAHAAPSGPGGRVPSSVSRLPSFCLSLPAPFALRELLRGARKGPIVFAARKLAFKARLGGLGP